MLRMQIRVALWLASIITVGGSAQAQWTPTVLHSFEGSAKGASPASGLVRDAAGNLYGTAPHGGLGESPTCGVVYKLDTAGHESVLHSFNYEPGGCGPVSGVILDAAGNLYGTTTAGGRNNGSTGVVFKLDTAGHYSILHSFGVGHGGSHPSGGLGLDAAGNLYGTTSHGGRGRGVLFKLDPSGHETVIHEFAGGPNGAGPDADVVLDAAGNIYGVASTTTLSEGKRTYGTVYEEDASGVFTMRYSFLGAADGKTPGAVIVDAAGNLYGTTLHGGSGKNGVVYKMDATGHFKLLHAFSGSDGSEPRGRLILDSQGNLYGTTKFGGANNFGVVFKLDANGNETILHDFSGAPDGREPEGGVIADASGNLYGTTATGGQLNSGVVFRIGGAGDETILYNFNGASIEPVSGVARDGAGNLYGTVNPNLGEVYKVDAAGHYRTLYTFTGGSLGWGLNGVIVDAAGNLYGTAQSGGTENAGVVYKLDTAETLTVLYNFTGGADGRYPLGTLTRDSVGNLYGTTSIGGMANCGDRGCGVVFELAAAGNFSVLHTFSGSDGGSPNGSLVLDASGNLYGTTAQGGPNDLGTVFRVDSSGNFITLHAFTPADGTGEPSAGVTPDQAGNLYGTSFEGGTANAGTVFKLDTAGNLTILHSFTCETDGCYPAAAVTLDPAGNIYGTTLGGTHGDRRAGGVFELDTAGNLTVLYSFPGAFDGDPSGLIFDSSGNLYGATSIGGRDRQGFVYKLER